MFVVSPFTLMTCLVHAGLGPLLLSGDASGGQVSHAFVSHPEPGHSREPSSSQPHPQLCPLAVRRHFETSSSSQVLRAAAFLPSLLPDPAPSPRCVLQCSLPRLGAPAPLQGKARSWVSPPFSLPSPHGPAQHALLERGTGHSQPKASGGPCQAREDGWQCWFPPSHHGRHAGSTSIRGHSLNLHSPSLMQDRQNRRRQQKVTGLSQICWEIIHSTGSVCQEDSMVPG